MSHIGLGPSSQLIRFATNAFQIDSETLDAKTSTYEFDGDAIQPITDGIYFIYRTCSLKMNQFVME